MNLRGHDQHARDGPGQAGAVVESGRCDGQLAQPLRGDPFGVSDQTLDVYSLPRLHQEDEDRRRAVEGTRTSGPGRRDLPKQAVLSDVFTGSGLPPMKFLSRQGLMNIIRVGFFHGGVIGSSGYVDK